MTKRELLRIRKVARREGGLWKIGRGFALAVQDDGRTRVTGNGGSSYFDNYHRFYRWVKKGAPTRLGRLCFDDDDP